MADRTSSFALPLLSAFGVFVQLRRAGAFWQFSFHHGGFFEGSFLSGGWNLACTDAALVWEYFVLFTTIGYHEQTVLMVYGMGSYWNGWIGGTWSLQNAMAILG